MNPFLSATHTAFLWTCEASLAAAVLALIVFAVQRLLGKSLAPRLRYTLTLLVLIRLLLPVLPASPFSAANLLPHQLISHAASKIVLPVYTFSAPQAVAPAARLTSSPPAVTETKVATITIPEILSLLWLAGIAALTLLAIRRYRQWQRYLAAAKTVSDPQLLAFIDETRRALSIRRPVSALVVPRAASAAVFGFWKVRLLLPQDMLDRLTATELRLVLLHEMAHIRRHDTRLNALLMAAQFLHWFNPFAWLALHRLRADRELICDELVLRHTRPGERAAYGPLLLKLIQQFPADDQFLPHTAIALGNQNEIKRRIVMIKNHGQNRLTTTVIALIAMTLLCGVMFTRADAPAVTAPIRATSQTARAADAEQKYLTALATIDAQGKTTDATNSLIGAWVLVGEPGHIHPAPVKASRIKLFTGSEWCITQSDPKTGVVIFHHGGSYTFDGHELRTTLDYANNNTKYLIGHTNRFAIKIEGDTLTQIGLGNPWNEVWQRMK